MIARNYIKYPEALRFQCEMFSNGYKNSPRIMRLMTVIFDWKLQAPQWVKDAMEKAKRLVKRCKEMQMELFSTFGNVNKSDLGMTIESANFANFLSRSKLEPWKTSKTSSLSTSVPSGPISVWSRRTCEK